MLQVFLSLTANVRSDAEADDDVSVDHDELSAEDEDVPDEFGQDPGDVLAMDDDENPDSYDEDALEDEATEKASSEPQDEGGKETEPLKESSAKSEMPPGQNTSDEGTIKSNSGESQSTKSSAQEVVAGDNSTGKVIESSSKSQGTRNVPDSNIASQNTNSKSSNSHEKSDSDSLPQISSKSAHKSYNGVSDNKIPNSINSAATGSIPEVAPVAVEPPRKELSHTQNSNTKANDAIKRENEVHESGLGARHSSTGRDIDIKKKMYIMRKLLNHLQKTKGSSCSSIIKRIVMSMIKRRM